MIALTAFGSEARSAEFGSERTSDAAQAGDEVQPGRECTASGRFARARDREPATRRE